MPYYIKIIRNRLHYVSIGKNTDGDITSLSMYFYNLMLIVHKE